MSWLRWSGGSPTSRGRRRMAPSIHVSLLDRALVTTLRRRVSVVMTWPVNDADRLEAVLALGANGVISDETDVLREVVNRRPCPPAS